VGETLEAVVAREVAEETGVAVRPASISYVASQPWPFPRSLMIGFTAAADSSDSGGGASSGGAGRRPGGYELLPEEGRRAAIGAGLRPEEVAAALGPRAALPAVTPDPKELEGALWAHRDAVAAALRASGDAAPSGSAAAAGTAEMGVPGAYSLANQLMRGWAAGGGGGGGGGWAGDALPTVSLGAAGAFKYVLLRLSEPSGGRSKLLAWGDERASYHNNILEHAAARAAPLGLRVEALGGGRMEYRPQEAALAIYGYSMAFGPAPHEVAAALVADRHPLLAISTSYDGY
jgi:ADP-ribose pyrophosphatase YjhB (NUDIX family)